MKKLILTLVTAALLLPTLSAQATYRSDNRQDSRDIRRISRRSGRDAKQQCVRDNNQSNASCRRINAITAAMAAGMRATRKMVS